MILGVRPVGDKLTRAQISAAKFESGKVILPTSAPWLAELEEELFAFPQSRYDDQVDSMVQALLEQTSSFDIGALADGFSLLLSRPLWSVPYWYSVLLQAAISAAPAS
jgi:hypothetical protein